jgi:hypothetical protein
MSDDAHHEWLSLLPYMDAEEFRELLGEEGAARLGAALASCGIATRGIRSVPCDPTGRALSAHVLTDLYGHPKSLLE